MDRETEDLEISQLAFDERGLVPVIVQQYDTLEVLMLAWMDQEAIRRTLETGRAWYWSRSRQMYWMKGESSGNIQEVMQLRYDCDGDTLLLSVDQKGPACHTSHRTCFYRTLLPGKVPSTSSRTAATGDMPLS
ncbi:MAG: phosphoribosyl-AMP cyclohydrolase [Actinomycetia bacterium]|nr:phosphoribosyl-AMP cyclohydrolase [Actinomycetes bacterium]